MKPWSSENRQNFKKRNEAKRAKRKLVCPKMERKPMCRDPPGTYVFTGKKKKQTLRSSMYGVESKLNLNFVISVNS